MRRQPPYEGQVLAHLQNGPLGFSQLVVATGVPNSPSLSRTLKRLCREGTITRTVLVEMRPPRVLYALADTTETPSGAA
jgi:DNA-binding HxlR family transcriptional regulator